MPSEKARVEVYVPDLPVSAYQKFLESLEEEFTYGFGGCTTQRGLSGSYLSDQGVSIQDRINMIYTDLPYSLTGHLALLSVYADELREAAFRALNEEAVLVTVTQVYHPKQQALLVLMGSIVPDSPLVETGGKVFTGKLK